MKPILEIKSVKTLANYHLEVEFEDGLKKNINFLPFIKDGVSKQLANKQMFNTAKVDYGTVVWENGYDVCPLVLRQL